MSPNAHADRHCHESAELAKDCAIAVKMLADAGVTDIPLWLRPVRGTDGRAQSYT